MTDRMTSAQQELAEENIGIAKTAACKFYRATMCQSDKDSIMSSSLIGLCNAAIGYKESTGKRFFNYAYRACMRQIGLDLKTNGLFFVPQHVLRNGSKNHKFRPAADLAVQRRKYVPLDPQSDSLVGREPPCEIRLQYKEAQEAVNALPERERAVIQGVVDGFTPADIGRKLGLSRQMVRIIQSDTQSQLRQMFCENDTIATPPSRVGDHVAELIARGASILEISKRIGRTYTATREIMKRSQKQMAQLGETG